MMKTIPQEFLTKFYDQLMKAGMPSKDHVFLKVALYYVDFCFKYGHDSKLPESLPHFMRRQIRELMTDELLSMLQK